jgi:hypothetical protein
MEITVTTKQNLIMKQKNKVKRLKARIDGFDAIRGTGGTDKKKKVNKSEFTRPGSLKR